MAKIKSKDHWKIGRNICNNMRDNVPISLTTKNAWNSKAKDKEPSRKNRQGNSAEKEIHVDNRYVGSSA